MPKHFYTLLIIPHKKKDSVKKFLATPQHFRLATAVTVVLFCFFGYCAIDYLTIKLEQWELANLRHLTSTQQEQIDTLQEKVSFFERKLADLKQVDEKIRSMASDLTGKSRKAPKKEAAVAREQALGVGGPTPAGEAGEDKLTNLNRHMDRLLEDAAARERSLVELQDFL
jgi:hypothetical protein